MSTVLAYWWERYPFPVVNFTLLVALILSGTVAVSRALRSISDLYAEVLDLLKVIKEYLPILRAMKERATAAIQTVEEQTLTVSAQTREIGAQARDIKAVVATVMAANADAGGAARNGITIETPAVTINEDPRKWDAAHPPV